MFQRKNMLYSFIMVALFVLVLAACSDENNNANDNNNNEGGNASEVENTAPSLNGDDNDSNENNGNNDNANEINNQGNSENSDDETSRSDRVGEDEWADDESGLSIGDTGLSDSNVGKAEITLDSAEMVDSDELEEDIDVTQLISVHITLKNVGEDTLKPEEVLYDGELHEEGKPYGNEWDYFDGISEEWQGELETGEETSGVIVFDHRDKDAYELIFGDDLAGVSNKLTFEFDKDEIDS